MNESSNGVNSIIERYIQRCIFFWRIRYESERSERKGDKTYEIEDNSDDIRINQVDIGRIDSKIRRK